MHITKAKCYTSYGFSRNVSRTACVTGFNGMPLDNHSGGYHLGNGYRLYKPILMRFSSPDRLSPFGTGGENAYSYCAGDPVNRVDPDGAAWWYLFGRRSRPIVQPDELKRGPLQGLPRLKATRTTLRGRKKLEEYSDALSFTVARWDTTPHIFEMIESHLGPHDLYVHKYAPSLVPDHLRARLKTLKKYRYRQHQEAILSGRDPSYTGHLSDALLSQKMTKQLTRFDEALRNAYAPFDDDQQWRYADPYLRRSGLSTAIMKIRDVPSQRSVPRSLGVSKTQ